MQPVPDVRAEWGGYDGAPKRRLVVVSPGVCDCEELTTGGHWKSVGADSLGLWDLASLTGYRLLPFSGPRAEKIPLALDSVAFRKAWADWHAYRRERKLSKWTERTRALKLEELARVGSSAAVEAIKFSMSNGYQGLIIPKNGGQSAQAPVPTESRNQDIAAWGKRKP